jgi:hypothetical protein
MITSEAEARKRYKHVEKEADEWNRIIGVRRLKPSEQSKLIGMTAELSGFDIVNLKDDEGTEKEMQSPHRGPLMIAAAVCEITSAEGEVARLLFPRNRAELDSVYDRLDIPGLQAATRAMVRLVESDKTEGTVLDEAKK